MGGVGPDVGGREQLTDAGGNRSFQAVNGFCAKMVLVAAVGLVSVAGAVACPGCKDNVNSSGSAQDAAGGLTRLERGYSYSVLFLLAVPAGLVGGLALMISKECRRIARRER